MAARSGLFNWGGNIRYGTDVVERPGSIEELQQLVARSNRLRTLGTGHSFNRVADSDALLVSVAGLPTVLELDSAAATVRISAGLRFGELTGFLDRHGFALANLGSLPHISVAGACATGTHGSGNGNPALAALVRAQQRVGPDGSLVEQAAGEPDFDGSVLALGLLGPVTELTLALVPSYQVRQYVYDSLPFRALAEHFDEISAAAYSFSVFTSWRGDAADQLWLKSQQERAAGDCFGARPAAGPRHPLPDGDTSAATEQGGVPGPWQARLPHFRLEFTPSNGDEIQSEYFIERAHLPAAIGALRAMSDVLAPVLQVSEVRTIAADELWLSPFYRCDRVALHFTWVLDEPAVSPVVQELEARLADFDAVPHWGKYFHTSSARLAELHPRLADFAALVRRHDPAGKFSNAFTRECGLG